MRLFFGIEPSSGSAFLGCFCEMSLSRDVGRSTCLEVDKLADLGREDGAGEPFSVASFLIVETRVRGAFFLRATPLSF
jgi:hypothetical protein